IPAEHEYGVNYDTFEFRVQDDGGVTDGGVDTDQSANVVTINVTEVNDAPDGADATLVTLEDTAYTFTTADFGFTDANDNPADSFLSVVVTTTPLKGT